MRTAAVIPYLRPSVLALADGEAVTSSWIQVAKTGSFFSQRYGKFSITVDDLKQMLHNFTSVTPIAPTQLPVDYDHLSMDPKKPGDGKAAGWFVTGKMELRASGEELWAEIAWTPEGAAAIKNGEYRFVSPSFIRDYVWKNGKNIGTTLIAAAITNHPFLEGMAAVTLLSMNLGDITVPVDADVAVEEDASPNPAETVDSLKQETVMSVYKLRDARGAEVEVKADDLQKFVTDQIEAGRQIKPTDEGTVVISASKFAEYDNAVNEVRSLTEKYTTLAGENLKQRNEAWVMKLTARIDKLQDGGRITKPQREWALRTFATPDRQTAFEDWVPTNLPTVHMGKEYGSSTAVLDESEESDGASFMRIAKIRSEEKKISLRDAIADLSAERPDLAEAYRLSIREDENPRERVAH